MEEVQGKTVIKNYDDAKQPYVLASTGKRAECITICHLKDMQFNSR